MPIKSSSRNNISFQNTKIYVKISANRAPKASTGDSILDLEKVTQVEHGFQCVVSLA